MILCEIILIHAFRWHIKRSQRNRSQQQPEVYNIDVFVKYILLWSWIWFLPVSYSSLLADDLKLADKYLVIQSMRRLPSCTSAGIFLTCLVTNSLTTPTHLDKNDRVSFDQRIIRRSVFWVQRTVRTTTKSNQFQTSATREREGPSNLGPTGLGFVWETISESMKVPTDAHHWSVLFWSF